jgi:multidrug efflux pump subunit AcrB
MAGEPSRSPPNVEGRAAGEVTADAMKIAKAIEFPNGYGLTLGGASRDQAEIFSEMLTALVLGVGVMYLVLVMQFGSFTAPLPVMLSLPLSLIGVVLALLVTGGTLNLMSLIGVIMLMGLVAKNAILLLDCARREEAQGVDREEALMHAGRMRLRPILMTTFALVAGMCRWRSGWAKAVNSIGRWQCHHRWGPYLDRARCW